MNESSEPKRMSASKALMLATAEAGKALGSILQPVPGADGEGLYLLEQAGEVYAPISAAPRTAAKLIPWLQGVAWAMKRAQAE